MKFLSRLLLLIIIFTFNACSKDGKEISSIQENNQEDEMISAYKEGVATLKEGDAFSAAKNF